MFSHKHKSIIQEPATSVNYFRQFIWPTIKIFSALSPNVGAVREPPLTEPYIHKPLLILLLPCPTPTRRPASSVFSPGLWPGVQARGMLTLQHSPQYLLAPGTVGGCLPWSLSPVYAHLLLLVYPRCYLT